MSVYARRFKRGVSHPDCARIRSHRSERLSPATPSSEVSTRTFHGSRVGVEDPDGDPSSVEGSSDMGRFVSMTDARDLRVLGSMPSAWKSLTRDLNERGCQICA